MTEISSGGTGTSREWDLGEADFFLVGKVAYGPAAPGLLTCKAKLE